MGIQDRDWHKDVLREREEAENRKGFRWGSKKNGKHQLFFRGPEPDTYTPPSQRQSDWHWSLQVLLFIALCLLVFGFFKILKTFTG